MKKLHVIDTPSLMNPAFFFAKGEGGEPEFCDATVPMSRPRSCR
jgi:hypothetical protein